MIAAQAARTPQAIAVDWAGETWRYADLDGQANALARYLQERGVTRETPVGIFMERSVQMLVALLGTLKAGGYYLPLDPGFPRERLALMGQEAGVAVLLTQTSLLEALPVQPAHVLDLEAAAPQLQRYSVAPVASPATLESLAYVLYTSGSTGRPKGVEIPHRALANFLCAMAEAPGIAPTDRLVAVTTLSFDIAALELYLPLTVGATVVLASRAVAADGAQLAAYLAERGGTMLQATPSTWHMLLEAGWQGPATFKHLSGGEALSRSLADRLLAGGGELWNLYGPTETTVWSTVQRVRPGPEPVAVGRPLANTTLYLLDARQQLVPLGVPGEVYIGGAGVARGYLGQPALTAQRFLHHPLCGDPAARLYRTGDRGRYRPDGTLELLGRTDQQVKLRGYRIELGEIEAVLSAQAGVEEVVVLLTTPTPTDEVAGARLVAYVVLQPGAAVTAATLREAARQHLPEYMVPPFYMFLPQLPRTANQKVDRQALPPPPAAATPAAAAAPPQTATEQTLATIWAEALGLEQVGREDDFFELGGHSLLAVRVFARMEEALGVRLPLATLFTAPTIAQLAATLTQPAAPADWACLVPIHPQGTRPPLYCVHGEGGEVLFYRGLSPGLGPDQPLYGLQARGLDGVAPPDTTVEAMAHRYLQEVRQHQPTGPYYLAGHCFGSLVAFEMAQQLQAAGQEVGLLAMLDGAGPPVTRTWADSWVNWRTAAAHDPLGLLQYVLQVDVPERWRRFLRARQAPAPPRRPIRSNAPWRGSLRPFARPIGPISPSPMRAPLCVSSIASGPY